MTRRTVDLASHLNQSVVRGHPADFPIGLKPVFYQRDQAFLEVPKRLAVIREDTGLPIAVVSDRYTLVPHQRILDIVDEAIEPLDVGPVPRGIYVDRQGANMRAIYKFPALAQPIQATDDICPCLQIRNTYDGSARIAIHIGAFRFVCTNLAVGGGGVFAGGFVSIHAGAIPIETVAAQLRAYLTGFDRIVQMYRAWTEQRADSDALWRIFDRVLRPHPEALWQDLESRPSQTVFEAYNTATRYATHCMRSHRTAFELLGRINVGFQQMFPVRDEAEAVNVG